MSKVLIVDDSLFIRNNLEKLLASHGYEIILAEDGLQAVARYQAERPDVVLMDVTMPNMNGLDALTQIRSFDRQAKVIMLTALNQGVVAARAIQMGAKDFLAKPVLPATLLLALRKVLR